MISFLKKQPPVRLIACGFLFVIFLGSFLLMLPISLNEGVRLSYIDALYTSVSAVCVTGLSSIEPGVTFTVFGKTVLGLLIQIGGLGVTTVGAGFIMLMGKKVLQRIEALETKLSDVPGQAADMAQNENLQTMERIFVQEESAPKGQELSVNHAESLINEVLSEVFS